MPSNRDKHGSVCFLSAQIHANSEACARALDETTVSDTGPSSALYLEVGGGGILGACLVLFILVVLALDIRKRRRHPKKSNKRTGGHSQAVGGPILDPIDPFTTQSPATQSQTEEGGSQPTPGAEQPATSNPTSASPPREDIGREQNAGSLPTTVASTSQNQGPWNDTMVQLVDMMTEVREELRTIGNAVHRADAQGHDEQPPEYVHELAYI